MDKFAHSLILAKNFFFCLFLIFSNASKWKGLKLSSLDGLSLVIPLLVLKLRDPLDIASLSSWVINSICASGDGDLWTSRNIIIFSLFFSCIRLCSSSSFLLGGLKHSQTSSTEIQGFSHTACRWTLRYESLFTVATVPQALPMESNFFLSRMGDFSV